MPVPVLTLDREYFSSVQRRSRAVFIEPGSCRVAARQTSHSLQAQNL
ncbi:MAG: hypothetical protein ABJZ62_04005 [Hyphomicrobiales bacterium]